MPPNRSTAPFNMLSADPAQIRFLRVLIFTLSLSCGLTAAVNVAVDPFGFFGFNRTGLFFSDERTFKRTQVRHYPHDALLLGDSRVGYIDPAEIRAPRFFNAAFAGATLEETLAFWERYEGNARLIVLGLLYSDLSEEARPGERFEPPGWRDYLRHALSIELFVRSTQAAARWHAGRPSTYRDNGSRAAIAEEIADLKAGALVRPARWPGPSGKEPDLAGPARTPCADRTRGSASAAPSARVSRLAAIARLAEKRGARLIVFVHPRHREILKSGDYATPSADLIDALCRLPLTFIDLTDSRYSDPDFFWITDHTHYKPEVGAAIITDVLRRSGVWVETR